MPGDIGCLDIEIPCEQDPNQAICIYRYFIFTFSPAYSWIYKIHINGYTIHINGYTIHINGYTIHINGYTIHING